MTDIKTINIKTGLWQSTLDGSYIKVKNVLETYVTYSDECCSDTHVMNKRELISCYKLVEADKPAPVIEDNLPPVCESISTRLERIIQAAIEIRTERNLLEDSVGGGEIQWAEAMTEPVNKLVVALNQYQIDDTFNDDTPAQTFGDIKWDEGVGEKCVRVAVCLTCDAKMPEDSLDFYVINQGLGCPNCKANAGKPVQRKHAHYFKDISDFDEMDTYLFCRVWKVKDDSGALHHALKKLMDAGKRGNKDKLKDVAEARDTLNRYLEIEAMFTEISE